MNSGDHLLDAAISWQIKLASPLASENDWSEFTDWLCADPEHGLAYDRVALADQAYDNEIGTNIPLPLLVQNDNQPVHWYQRRALLAFAASIVLALISVPFLINDQDFQTIQTGPGETRQIALQDGSLITLNGASRVELDANGGRYAKLTKGEALFTIVHDADRPFIVKVDNHTLVDVGTIFNVRNDDDGVEVAVSHGAVEFNPDKEAVLVRAGSQVNMARKATKPVLKKIEAAGVGGWRNGQLAYSDAEYSRIAADLSRTLGEPVIADPSVRNRRFSGIIQIDANRGQSMQRLQALLGVNVRRSDKGWALSD